MLKRISRIVDALKIKQKHYKHLQMTSFLQKKFHKTNQLP